ncbi:MAG: succinylglutamate desuccinylase/aspartoacylase family protein, partial [Candidatus Omnitrophica bacterium]|nr:succinylglutamate desuccinylase/aspartoacylase family protein [Candidatus Omnitrophota bacterium]
MIAIGGLHGNELAGVHALETLFRMLEEEPRRNPDFQFKGTFIGLRGNLRALRNGSRQMVKDLNRQFTTDNINRVLQFPESFLDEEDMELKELYLIIISLLRQYRPTKLVIIDLHTTSASGGIFSIVSDHPESLRIATALHVPVIKGLMNGLSGTTMHFFNKHNLGIDTIAMG